MADFNADALESYLSSELGVHAVGTEPLSDKLNLVLVITTRAGERYVVRRPNELRRTDLFNDLADEYEVLRRLRETAVPAQTPALLCDDESILGGPFLVAPYSEGETIPIGSDLPDRFRNPRARGEVGRLLVDTLAAVHGVDPVPFEEVCDRITPREQVVRAADRIDEATRATGEERPTLRAVERRLLRNAPSDAEMTLVHGDFRPSNLLFSGTERPEIAAVLDWETAVVGDPLTELGYLLLRWRDEADTAPAFDRLGERRATGDARKRLEEIHADWRCPFSTAPGSPDRRELVARYEERSGRTFDDPQFYRAHAAFMLATVWADLGRLQVESGSASDYGPLIDYMTAVAADAIDSGSGR